MYRSIDRTSLAIVRGSQGFEVDRIPVPALGLDDVLLEMHLVGICGTDIDMAGGHRGDVARILGHEGIATVSAIGESVRDIEVGQRVVFNPVSSVDQDLILGHSYDGLLQQRFVATGTLRTHLLVPVLDWLRSELAIMAEPLATVIYGVDLLREAASGIRSAVIVGGGSFGLLAAARLAGEGCRVLLVEPSSYRREWAIRNGLVAREDALASLSLMAEARNIKPGVDVGFVCTPRETAYRALNTLATYIRSNGCIDLVTGFEPNDQPRGLEVTLNQIRRANVSGTGSPMYWPWTVSDTKQVWLTGHRGSSVEQIEHAMRLLDVPSVFGDLISHVLPMSDARNYFQGLAEGRPKFDAANSRKLVVNMNA